MSEQNSIPPDDDLLATPLVVDAALDEVVRECGVMAARELIEVYLSDAQERLAHLREALERGDARISELESHSLKSSSAALGARRVSTFAATIEKLTGSGVTGPRAHALLAGLTRALSETEPLLRRRDEKLKAG